MFGRVGIRKRGMDEEKEDGSFAFGYCYGDIFPVR